MCVCVIFLLFFAQCSSDCLLRRAVDTCHECSKQICQECAAEGNCGGCREVTALAASVTANALSTDKEPADDHGEEVDAIATVCDQSDGSGTAQLGGAAQGVYRSRDTLAGDSGAESNHFILQPTNGTFFFFNFMTYIYVYTCVHTYIYMCACISIYKHIRTNACTYISLIYIYMYTYTNV